MQGLNDVNYKGLFNFEIPGENRAPTQILRSKLSYIHELSRYMLSDEFLL